MTAHELRQALGELKGDRDLSIMFAQTHPDGAMLAVSGAMLVPEEPDHLVKVTDGHAVYLIDAERIAWIKIGTTTLT
ncbi:MAG: hypothetical protein KAS72_00420 [Phycisphaerales bacterium]|nr:hypothetical protein [Phycisphaerales bacterium]